MVPTSQSLFSGALRRPRRVQQRNVTKGLTGFHIRSARCCRAGTSQRDGPYLTIALFWRAAPSAPRSAAQRHEGFDALPHSFRPLLRGRGHRSAMVPTSPFQWI